MVRGNGSFRVLRMWAGGEDGFRDSVRTRGVPGCTDAVAIAAAIGDDGTVE